MFNLSLFYQEIRQTSEVNPPFSATSPKQQRGSVLQLIRTIINFTANTFNTRLIYDSIVVQPKTSLQLPLLICMHFLST